ncbi:MAG: MBL fold metallo-hydrolase [Firmicutes bacterium]|nr:MBL fold metallo-hydrolase [Bacillota bacterium]
MIKHDRYGEIVQLMMGRKMNGTVLYWTAAYLVEGLLIDTGCAHTAAELCQFLGEKELALVVNTHHHEDHIGANLALQQQRGLQIYAHPLAVPLINRRLPLRQYQEMVWGYPEPSQVLPVSDTIATRSYSFQVLETPGHASDHISLFEPEQGWCFSGDLFVSENQKMLRSDEDIDGIIGSLEKLLLLPVKELILFTSIGRVFTDGKSSIRRYLGYLESLRGQVDRLAGRSLDPSEIRDRIFGRETRLAELTGGHFSVLNLVEQLMGAQQ